MLVVLGETVETMVEEGPGAEGEEEPPAEQTLEGLEETEQMGLLSSPTIR